MGTPRLDKIDKNLLINGNFEFWQRGTTFNPSTYGADRWIASSGAAASGFTRQTGGPSTRSKYFARIVGSGGGSGNIGQRIESTFLRHFQAGESLTVHFYMKTTSGTPDASLRLKTPNAMDDYTTSTDVVTQALGTISTSWAPFSYTFALTSTMISNGLSISIGHHTPNSSTYDIAEVMLVAGTNASEWGWSGRDYADELKLCQRYYEKSYDLDVNPTTAANGGRCFHRTSGSFSAADMISQRFLIHKRVDPTVIIYSPNDGASGNYYDLTGAANRTAIANTISETAFTLRHTGGGTTADASFVSAHWTADAEIN